jgi:hypothetical protein
MPGYFVDWVFWDNNLIIPVWIWILLILVFVGFVMLVAMVYIWFIMRPVAGYGKAGLPTDVTKGSPTQVFSIWKNRSFVIETLMYYGNLLSYPDCFDRMQMWLHTSERAVGLSAEKPVMITRDGFNRTVDFIAEMAVCELPKIFNRDWGMEEVPKRDINGNPVYDKLLKEDGTFVNVPVMVTQERKDDEGKPYMLTNFTDIYKRLPLLERLYPEGVPIPIYQPYDLSQIYTFTPKGEDSLKAGGIIVDDAKDWVAEDEGEKAGWLERNAQFLVLGMFCLITTVFVYYAFP